MRFVLQHFFPSAYAACHTSATPPGALRRGLLDKRLARSDGLLGVFLLRPALFQVLVAERLRRIVVRLLLLENFFHTVDHRKNLGEVDLLCLQAHLEQLELRLVRPTLTRQVVPTPRAKCRSRFGKRLS